MTASFRFFALSIAFAVALTSSALADTFLERTRPDRNFFTDHVTDCINCKTITVVVSPDETKQNIQDYFRPVAEAFGKDHAGTIIGIDDAWANSAFFDRYGCPRLDRFGDRFVVYVDRDDQFCGAFRYVSQDHLVAIVSIISADLGNASRIGIGNWRRETNRKLTSYFEDNPLARPMEPFASAFVAYVAGIAKKYH